MAETPSKMISLGRKAPDFCLKCAVSDKFYSLQELKSEIATVIMFICNHCPFVKLINEGLVKIANDYNVKGVSFIAINSNDIENYPEDSPENMKKLAKQLSYPFPYLFDETQEVAMKYDAACTPDLFVFDKDLNLVYRGQFDDARPGNRKPVTGSSLRAALDDIIDERPVSIEQKPSIGCNIKWKKF